MTALDLPLEARHQISFRFGREMLGKAFAAPFRDRATLFFGLVVFAIGVDVYLNGALTPTVGWICLGTGLIVGARLFTSWRASVKRTMELWSKLSPDGDMVIRLGEDELEVRVGKAVTRYAWSDLRQVKTGAVWKLEIAKHLYVMFPAEDAAPEAIRFVRERCQAVGVKVR